MASQQNEKSESQRRLELLRELLQQGELSSQEELVEALRKQRFTVTQSTVSRDLRRLGAVKAVDPLKGTLYRISADGPMPLAESAGLQSMIREIQANDSMIVIHTSPGSASLLARQLDSTKPAGLLGTIAGDDTIFVAPASGRAIPATIRAIQLLFSNS